MENNVLDVLEITCERCGKKFEMPPAEQKFYLDLGFTMPKKCPDCRKLRRQIEKHICVDCNAEFEITELEKEYYEQRGFQTPKRCKKCRDFKKQRNNISSVDEEEFD